MARQEVTRGTVASYAPALLLAVSLFIGGSGCGAQLSQQSAVTDDATVETLPTAATTEGVNTPTPSIAMLPSAVEPVTSTAVAEGNISLVTAAPDVTESISDTAPVAPTEVVTTSPTDVIAVTPAPAPPIASNKLYNNSTYNYTVAYPGNWWPSGIAYANAFEIRNYEPQNPASVPEEQRASVIIVDTVNETAAVTEAYLDTLLAGEGAEEIIIDGHRAVRIQRERAGQQLGPGASQTGSVIGTVAEVPRYLTISTYVANGAHLISIEASVPIEADVRVSEEIINIENSVRFGAAN